MRTPLQKQSPSLSLLLLLLLLQVEVADLVVGDGLGHECVDDVLSLGGVDAAVLSRRLTRAHHPQHEPHHPQHACSRTVPHDTYRPSVRRVAWHQFEHDEQLHYRLGNKPFLIWLSKTPPHLQHVATLHCDLSLMACFAETSGVARILLQGGRGARVPKFVVTVMQM